MRVERAQQGDLYAMGWDAAMREVRKASERAERPVAIPRTRMAPARIPEYPAANETFGEMLSRLRVRLLVSRCQLAHDAGCDPSYLTRIERDERAAPKRHLVDALARLLHLSEFEYRQFVTAAGAAPVMEWTPELEAAYKTKGN